MTLIFLILIEMKHIEQNTVMYWGIYLWSKVISLGCSDIMKITDFWLLSQRLETCVNVNKL